MDIDALSKWQNAWYDFIIEEYAKNGLRLDEDYWEVVVCKEESLVWIYGKGPDAFTRDGEACETKSQDRDSSTNIFIKEGGSGKTYDSIQIVFAKDFGTLPQCKYVYVIIWITADQYNLYRVDAKEALEKLNVKKAVGSTKTSHHFSIKEINQFDSFKKVKILMPEDDYDQYVERWGEEKAKRKMLSIIVQLKYDKAISSMDVNELKVICRDYDLQDEGSMVELKQRIKDHILAMSIDELIHILR